MTDGAAIENRVTTPAPRSAWHELLEGDSDALVSQSPGWVDALCADGSHEDASLLYQAADGGRFLLPLVRRRGPWPQALGPRASMPHAWGMGGLLSARRPARGDLTGMAAGLAADPAIRTSIRPNPLHAELWSSVRPWAAAAIPRRAHVLDLEGGPDRIWRGFHQSARRGVRKAERSGLEVECDTTGRLVPVFHRLLRTSTERWASQQHEPARLARFRAQRRDPVEKFERLAAALGEAMRVWVAWKDGEPAASILVLRGTNASYTRGAMEKELAGPTHANDLLQWLAIQDAIGAGCRTYHLGESGWSTGLSRFKEKLGARPVPYSEFRFERLPLTRADGIARGLVKRALRFKDGA
jgi:Acetyltransferase (GNAT) domain